MPNEKTCIRVGDLKSREDFPFARLEGVGPNLAGWGVVETCLLLPEAVCIMAGPSACLRHSAFMAHARGFTERFFMLCTPELDMTLGRHLDIVEKGIAEIAAQREEKVVFLIVCCPDYILGTDFTGVIERLEKQTGKHIILGAMAPITIGLKDSPFTSAYSSFYDFLKHVERKPDPDAVNLLGTFMPLSDSGELYRVLHGAGISKVHQIPLCDDLEQFAQMAHAGSSLVLHPLANGLNSSMEKGMGIASAFVPTSYGFSSIATCYDRIAATIGRSLDTESIEAEARKAAAPLLEDLKGKTIAVGCSINGSPWELATALVEFGLQVDVIFARGTFKPYEWGYIERLREIAPDIRAFNASHPSLCGKTAPFDHVDLAYGVDAGIFCTKAANVPLSRYQEQMHGYENTLWMLEQTRAALTNPVANYEWIYHHDFLI
ncbi:MAG: nitrogenase component 1 [Desulfovibrio sp.]|uniref:nitrogenase component 1 n=1 Tax=Desulfovibrio sp. 7SRBS1 TaxID=3378064 RepID=UPI003B3BFAEF